MKIPSTPFIQVENMLFCANFIPKTSLRHTQWCIRSSDRCTYRSRSLTNYRLYAGTVRQLDARKVSQEEVTFTMEALKINDFLGHLTLLIFNSAKKIIYSTAKVIRYENQFRF